MIGREYARSLRRARVELCRGCPYFPWQHFRVIVDGAQVGMATTTSEGADIARRYLEATR